MSNQEKVMAFIAAWEAKDADGILAKMTPDAIYHNIPMEPLNGHEAIRRLITTFLAPATNVRWTVHFIAETPEGVVLTERTDEFEMSGGKEIVLKVMGSFEFNSGLISAWRDYFDLAQFQAQAA